MIPGNVLETIYQLSTHPLMEKACLDTELNKTMFHATSSIVEFDAQLSANLLKPY